MNKRLICLVSVVLLLALAGNASAVVITWNDDGTGGFTVVGSYPTGESPEGIAVADFDEDGALDVVTADSSTVSLLLGGGDGTLGPSDSFACCDGYPASFLSIRSRPPT